MKKNLAIKEGTHSHVNVLRWTCEIVSIMLHCSVIIPRLDCRALQAEVHKKLQYVA